MFVIWHDACFVIPDSTWETLPMRVLIIPAFILATLLSACIIVVGDDGGSHGHWDNAGHSTVNRAIHVGEAQTVGDLDSVNGSIGLGDRSVAGSVETVNGSIRIGDDAVVDSIESVNGNIRAGMNLRVADDIETVNGGLEFAAGTRIGGGIDTVNGSIVMTQTRVQGEISTVGGDIDTGRSSWIGSITVEESQGWQGGHSRRPRIVIGPATVVGPLRFEHAVDLYVHESADTGTIHGATARIYSGDSP